MSGEPPDPRILFAAERTLLAYVRTGLALMGFGFVVARFGLFLRQIALATGGVRLPAPSAFTLVTGTVLVVLGALVCAASVPWYVRTLARLQAGQPYTPPVVGVGVIVAGAVGAAGLGMAVYLVTLPR